MSRLSTMVILNSILVIIGIILFSIGYMEKMKFRKRLKANKNLDAFEETVKGGKVKFITVDILCGRFIPFIIFVEVIFSYFYGLEKASIEVQIIKLIAGIIIGLIYGIFQWNFYNNLVNRNMEVFKKFAFMYKYIIFNGLVAWGAMIGIAVCFYPNVPFLEALAQFLSWLLAGLFFGLLDWKKTKMRYAHYLGERKRKMHRA